ncbi:hypothetical protein [Azospirillum sp. SYSU D00513]|uniref:hypothetical protein n=1 Tax=Azospirillum sp. SYSU D00513 TaxID=2812561 RepID=UPI001A963080|nr:hypothetical protein [Azospirillum sp. SYSU D00513]
MLKPVIAATAAMMLALGSTAAPSLAEGIIENGNEGLFEEGSEPGSGLGERRGFAGNDYENEAFPQEDGAGLEDGSMAAGEGEDPFEDDEGIASGGPGDEEFGDTGGFIEDENEVEVDE